MKLKFLALFLGLMWVSPSVFAAAATGSPVDATVPPYLQEVKRISSAIRVAENDAAREPLFVQLRSLLEHPVDDCAAYPVYVQAGYALCVNGAVESPVLEHLRGIQAQETPVKINDNMYYSVLPLGGGFVVLERLTPDNIDVWKQYAEDRSFSRPPCSSRYEIERPGSTIPQWRKYLLNDYGWKFFRDRIAARWKISNPYDIWVSYLSNTDPRMLAEKRLAGGAIDRTDLRMVMTVQMQMGLDTYSPAGISRTPQEAQRLYAEEQAGTPRQKIDPSESIWFHALTGRILQSINPSLKSLWTTPLESMGLIFVQALYPQWKLFPSTYSSRLIDYVRPEREASTALLSDFLEYDESLKVKVLSSDAFPACPWKDDNEFVPWSLPGIQIQLTDLWGTLFPYMNPRK